MHTVYLQLIYWWQGGPLIRVNLCFPSDGAAFPSILRSPQKIPHGIDVRRVHFPHSRSREVQIHRPMHPHQGSKSIAFASREAVRCLQ